MLGPVITGAVAGWLRPSAPPDMEDMAPHSLLRDSGACPDLGPPPRDAWSGGEAGKSADKMQTRKGKGDGRGTVCSALSA